MFIFIGIVALLVFAGLVMWLDESLHTAECELEDTKIDLKIAKARYSALDERYTLAEDKLAELGWKVRVKPDRDDPSRYELIQITK